MSTVAYLETRLDAKTAGHDAKITASSQKLGALGGSADRSKVEGTTPQRLLRDGQWGEQNEGGWLAMYVEIPDPRARDRRRILLKYDPARCLVEVRDRDGTVVIDLTKYGALMPEKKEAHD
jgi:hypothetical protein